MRASRLAAEDRAEHLGQRSLQVGERDPLADRQALDLVEHRAVGGVGVAPVDLARGDHEDRRRLRLHAADLHRRGVGAQQHLGVRLHVEGVLQHPRRVPGRVVQRGEVVVVVLDLGPLHHPVAEADHHVLDLAGGAGDQVGVADRPRRRARQGHVDPVLGQPGFELAGIERRAARLDQRLQLLARLVGARPDRAPFLGGQVGDAAQDRGQLGLAAEVADPQLLQLGGARRRLDRRRGLRGDRLDPIDSLRHLQRPPAWRATISARRADQIARPR